MANKKNRYQDGANRKGKFYVDDECIGCDECNEIAPRNFTRNDYENHAYVMKQPANEEEEELCKAAMENCPVGAIGDDGL